MPRILNPFMYLPGILLHISRSLSLSPSLGSRPVPNETLPTFIIIGQDTRPISTLSRTNTNHGRTTMMNKNGVARPCQEKQWSSRKRVSRLRMNHAVTSKQTGRGPLIPRCSVIRNLAVDLARGSDCGFAQHLDSRSKFDGNLS